MKKSIIFGILLIIIVNLTGCEGKESKTTKRIIETSSGIYQNKEWDSKEFPVTVDCVPDGDTAISVAKSILVSMQKDGKYPDYLPQSVFLIRKIRFGLYHFILMRGAILVLI